MTEISDFNFNLFREQLSAPLVNLMEMIKNQIPPVLIVVLDQVVWVGGIESKSAVNLAEVLVVKLQPNQRLTFARIQSCMVLGLLPETVSNLINMWRLPVTQTVVGLKGRRGMIELKTCNIIKFCKYLVYMYNFFPFFLLRQSIILTLNY